MLSENRASSPPTFSRPVPLKPVGTVQTVELHFHANPESIHYTGIDEEWLKESQLAYVREECLGKLEKDIRVADFRFDFQGESGNLPREPTIKRTPDEIVLPANPSPKQVMSYIDELLTAFKGKKDPADDGLVQKLVHVGPDNITMLARMGRDYQGVRQDVGKAILELSGKEHKHQVIEQVEHYPVLLETVNRHGWQKEAREVLRRLYFSFDAYTDTEHLKQWATAVMHSDEPGLYRLLEKAVRKDNGSLIRHIAYQKRPPQYDITPAVKLFWEQRRYDRGENLVRYLIIPIAFGVTDALDTAFMLIENPCLSDKYREYVWKIINMYLEIKPKLKNDRQSLVRWYRQNKDRLQYDPKNRKYSV